jgi:hypothetical protein
MAYRERGCDKRGSRKAGRRGRKERGYITLYQSLEGKWFTFPASPLPRVHWHVTCSDRLGTPPRYTTLESLWYRITR